MVIEVKAPHPKNVETPIDLTELPNVTDESNGAGYSPAPLNTSSPTADTPFISIAIKFSRLSIDPASSVPLKSYSCVEPSE